MSRISNVIKDTLSAKMDELQVEIDTQQAAKNNLQGMRASLLSQLDEVDKQIGSVTATITGLQMDKTDCKNAIDEWKAK